MRSACQLSADEVGPLAGNHIEKRDAVEGVLPVNDEEGGGLFIEVEILAQETPEGSGLAPAAEGSGFSGL